MEDEHNAVRSMSLQRSESGQLWPYWVCPCMPGSVCACGIVRTWGHHPPLGACVFSCSHSGHCSVLMLCFLCSRMTDGGSAHSASCCPEALPVQIKNQKKCWKVQKLWRKSWMLPLIFEELYVSGLLYTDFFLLNLRIIGSDFSMTASFTSRTEISFKPRLLTGCFCNKKSHHSSKTNM